MSLIEYLPAGILFAIILTIWAGSKDIDKLASQETIASVRHRLTTQPSVKLKRHHYRSILQLYFGEKHLSLRCIILSYSLSLLVFIWASLFFDMFIINELIKFVKDYGDF